MKNEFEFYRDLREIINKNSMEGGSNTPDFLLAEYLVSCLKAYNQAVDRRAQWYRKDESDSLISPEVKP